MGNYLKHYLLRQVLRSLSHHVFLKRNWSMYHDNWFLCCVKDNDELVTHVEGVLIKITYLCINQDFTGVKESLFDINC